MKFTVTLCKVTHLETAKFQARVLEMTEEEKEARS